MEQHDDRFYLLVLKLKDGSFNKKWNSHCNERSLTYYMMSLIINHEEKLAFSCPLGDGIKLLGIETGSSNICYGGSGKIYLQVDGNSIVQLNAANSTFQGPLEGILHTDIYCKVMYYIPPPNDILVLIDAYSSSIFAMSFVKDEIVWEFQVGNQRGENQMYRKSKDRTGLLFYEKYNVPPLMVGQVI